MCQIIRPYGPSAIHTKSHQLLRKLYNMQSRTNFVMVISQYNSRNIHLWRFLDSVNGRVSDGSVFVLVGLAFLCIKFEIVWKKLPAIAVYHKYNTWSIEILCIKLINAQYFYAIVHIFSRTFHNSKHIFYLLNLLFLLTPVVLDRWLQINGANVYRLLQCKAGLMGHYPYCIQCTV